MAETESTNSDLLATAAARPDRAVLAAGHQTAGRGRLDRRWDAPPAANLLVSILFHAVPEDPGELTRRVSLAALDACRAESGLSGLSLKWPNDIVLNDVKLAGVLAQRDGTAALVVGIGINVGWCPDGAAKLGERVDPGDLLARLLSSYDALPTEAPALAARYRTELGTLGRRVRLQMPSGDDIVGTALDVTVDGCLVVLDDCAVTHRVMVGDIVHLRTS